MNTMTTMKKALAGTIVLLVIALSSQAAVVYDLETDWSDAANPNGVWSLKKNHVDLFTINQSDYFQNASGQKAWADHPSPQAAHVPFWMKGSSGQVTAHGAELDRTGSDYTAVVWTSPLGGEIQIDGALWPLGVSGRIMRWQLLVDGALVSQGDLVANGAYDVNNPFDLSGGSGGPGVLTQLVEIGDEIELGLVSISESGNLGNTVAVDFSVTPEPTTMLLLTAGIFPALMRRRRQS